MNIHRSTLKRGVGSSGIIWLLAFLLCSLSQTTLAQNASRWRVYKTVDGLDDSLCTTVTVSETNVWISHFQNGFVTRFDGYKMQKFPAPGIGPFRIHETAEGELWTVSGLGIQEFRNQKWVQYPIAEIRALGPTDSFAQLRLVSISPFETNRLLICSPQALLEFSKERSPQAVVVKSIADTQLKKFADMSPTKNHGVWVAGAKGIAHLQEELRDNIPRFEYQEFLPPADLGLENFQHPFPDSNGGVTLVADSIADQKRVIVWFDGKDWKVSKIREKVKLAWRDDEGNFWAMTSTSLLKRNQYSDEFIEEQELAVGQFLDAALGPGGLIWIATSDGLFCQVPLPWQTPPALRSINGRVHAMTEDDHGFLWVASNVGLHCYDGQTLQTFPYPETFERFFQPMDALFLFSKKKLLMNGDDRILQFDLETKTFNFLTYPNNARLRILGWIKEGVLCVQLLQGPHQKNQLQSFDGQNFTPITDLPEDFSSEITSFLVTQTGDCWIGSSTGVGVFNNGTWNVFSRNLSVAPDSCFSLSETIDGKVWCGGNERIWEFNGKSWASIRGGFDRVNKILKRSNGNYWIASNNGVRGLSRGDWLVNSVADGLPNTAVVTVFEDKKRRIWAGTAHGVSLHDPEIDLDAPLAYVERSSGNENNGNPPGMLTFTFHSEDRWRITQTERILYSYRLDEQDWSPWGAGDVVPFSELASGKHVFQLRAMDRSWNITPQPAIQDFTITLPWYQETRLILIALTGCGIACFFAVLAYNRHRKLVRSYAEIEKIVALRTEQLEKANRELLHSQKMTALGTLSAGIAHDFNNILSIIKGSAQIIETSIGDPEKIQTRVNRIKTVVEQGSGIVKAMLGFSRTSEKQLALCHVNNIVEDTIKLLGDRFLREVDIQFQPKSNLSQVAVSKEFIQQILLNFIFNAADSFNGPGKIILRSGRLEQLTDYVALRPTPAPEYLFIAVEDFGNGIAPETLPRIFEPFFTTKAFSARRGTGLGLSMVYELAKEMGAGLTVKSEVGKGSVFTLVLPLLPPGTAQPMN